VEGVEVTRSIEEVVLVDRHDVAIGRSEKVTAHRAPGLLHRAFSVLLFDEAGRLLLQRRHRSKYHFGGRWSNSCCGHPRPGEDIVDAAVRRVGEELGLHVAISSTGCFEYQACDPASGLVEHEIDHVLHGTVVDPQIEPDPREIDDWRWVDRPTLERWLTSRPHDFTPWFASVARVGWSTSR
jgi:isopentenyl-diphosphate delta-isomerase